MTPEKIVVVGLNGGGLDPERKRLIAGASLVVGGERHLAAAGVEGERSVVLKGDLSGAMERIPEVDGRVVVLASGDPGFFGIVRLLSGRFGSERLEVLPAPSSVALAFGRAGMSWEDAVVVSVHGVESERGPRRAVNVCRAHSKVCVLTRPGFGPGEIASELQHLGLRFAVGERLGMEGERVFFGDAEEVLSETWREPNVVIVYDRNRLPEGKSWLSGGAPGSGAWGLSLDEFEYRSAMITRPEPRSVVLSKLGPGVGDLIWDVGAGSGSVAVECARFGAAAIAVERDRESCGNVRKNAARHGLRVEVVEGEAPAALHGLPDPDAVFIGGTGGDFEGVVEFCAGRAIRSVVLTLITLERVVPAMRLLERFGCRVEAVQHQTSHVRPIAKMHRLVPESQVFIVSGTKG
ncbi:precorrin-6y C5,15-methyltransferase (decarboxylating) subunit CbiE [Rubrobacter indicoceani]|uniref:precorrin-6y C5,15-methyltransferase (decarboxylating) subunit CbiE n=1 Tax=Rubrobacter indicoceani TaxID=2051957 RepID=UPI000E5AAEB3|nr:precorrin-6y C5,15-methyltransferase (decarboxylating) subunit CbiE [Rubrobacter indicoceani]